MNKVILTLTYDALEKIINLPEGMKIVATQDHIETNCVKMRVVCEKEMLGENEQLVFSAEKREWNRESIKGKTVGDFYERISGGDFVV